MASERESLIRMLESKKRSGLKNSELQKLKELRDADNRESFGIAADLRRREQAQALQDMQAAQMADEQRMIAMNRLQMDLMDEYNRKQSIRDERDKSTKIAAGVDRATYNRRGSAADAAQMVGALYGDAPAPEKYIWRDLRPGETYVAGKDRVETETGDMSTRNYNDGSGEAISFSWAGEGPYLPGDGPGGKTIRRRIVNPAYQEWVTDRNKQMNDAMQMIGTPSQKPLSASLMKMVTDARNSGDTETLNMIRQNYPQAFPEEMRTQSGDAATSATMEGTGNPNDELAQAILGKRLLEDEQRRREAQQASLIGSLPNVDFSFVE